MDKTSRKPGRPQKDPPIGRNEMRLMNSRGREWLLKYWDFPLFASALRAHGISLSDTSILDAGCGSGYGLTLIQGRFHPAQLTAFDLVPSQVEIAKSRGTIAKVFVGDITAIDLPMASFDAVFVCGVLHHCREWRTGLAQVTRVLKNGGLLLMEEPDTAHLKFERLLTGNSPALESGFSHRALSVEMARLGLGILARHALYFGLFGSFLCVKGTDAVGEYRPARYLLRVRDSATLSPNQEAPA